MNTNEITPSTPTDNEEESNLITCKNCEAQFTGKYCSNCGQSVKEMERPLRFMIVDFMGTIVSFDTRLIKTLVAVLFKPAHLTIDFLEGRRARYMPPFRFYVFISFVMFLLISKVSSNSIVGNKITGDISVDEIKENASAIMDSIGYSQDSLSVAIRREVNKELAEANLDTIGVDKVGEVFPDQEDIIKGMEDFNFNIGVGNDEMESKLKRNVKKIVDYPELYVNKLYQYASWAFFLFMPVFAFFLYISFFRSKPLFIGHLIFALNIHSFLFTITTLVIIINLVLPDKGIHPEGYLFWFVPIYQVVGARALYKRTWVKSFFKMLLVWIMYSFVWIIGAILIAALAFIDL